MRHTAMFQTYPAPAYLRRWNSTVLAWCMTSLGYLRVAVPTHDRHEIPRYQQRDREPSDRSGPGNASQLRATDQRATHLPQA